VAPNQLHIHLVEVKHCEDTRLGSQLEAAHHQHSMLRQHLCQAAANVSLHTIHLGVGGTIYSPFSLEPLKHLGLDPQKVFKLAAKLHAHSVQYAYKLLSARRALEENFAAICHKDQEWGTASHPPDPLWLLLFSLLVESYGAWALGDSFSIIDVGSALLPA